MVLLKEFAKSHAKEIKGNIEGIQATGIEFDSQVVSRGKIFAALKGKCTDGHQYLKQAQENGACLAIVNQICDVDMPQICVENTYDALYHLAKLQRKNWKNKTVIALTGSVGKTTCKEMLKSLLQRLGKTHATYGNYNNKLGLSYTIINTPVDAEYVVLEVGISEVGEMDVLALLARPDIAFVTNVHPCHLKGLGTVDNIAIEKSKLYRALEPSGIAIMNNDDAAYIHFASNSQHCQQLNLFDYENTLHRKSVSINESGCAGFTAEVAGKKMKVQLNVLGKHQIYNAYACAFIASKMGLSHSEIENALHGVKAPQGRMKQYIEKKEKTLLIDDSYNASPESMQAAIECLSAIRKETKCLIMADMEELGVESDKMHRQVGVLANEKKIDYLLTVGKKSRLALDQFSGIGKSFEKKQDLMDYLYQIMKKDMVVLLKGSRASRLDDCVKLLVGVDYV